MSFFPPFQIPVWFFKGTKSAPTTLTLTLVPTWRVTDIVAALEKLTGLPPDQQCVSLGREWSKEGRQILWDGHQLNEDGAFVSLDRRMLFEIGIDETSVLGLGWMDQLGVAMQELNLGLSTNAEGEKPWSVRNGRLSLPPLPKKKLM